MADYSSGTGNCPLNKRGRMQGSYKVSGDGIRNVWGGILLKGEGPRPFLKIARRELNEFEV